MVIHSLLAVDAQRPEMLDTDFLITRRKRSGVAESGLTCADNASLSRRGEVRRM